MRTFGARSLANLVGVDPRLVLVTTTALPASPFDYSITEGRRLIERQRMLFESGASLTMHSMHLPQPPDGLSRAIDVMAVGDINGDGKVDHRDKSLTWNVDLYTAIWEAHRAAGVALNIPLEWGGHFTRHNGKPYFDGPHIQLA